jgi:hypothetical protein
MNNNQFGPLGPLLSAPPIAPLYAANLLMMPPFFAPPPAPVPLPVLPTHTHAHMHTHVQQPQAYAQQQPQPAAAQGLPSAGDVVECVMRQGQFDALRQRLSDAVRSHELVARLQAHARDLVDRHPQVQHQVRTGTESTLALHGVLGPPAAGARAQMANALFSSPLYREMRDFTRRLVNMPPLAPDVQSAVDRAAEHAVDLLAKPDVTDLTAAKKPPAVAALSVNDLLARKPPSLPPLKAAAAPPPPRAAVLGKAKAKAPLKDTEILIPRDASLLGLRYLIESEQAQAAADGDDDDDSISDDADVESNGGAELSKQAETASRLPLPDVEDGDDDDDAADPLALPTPKAAKVVATKVYKFHCSTCNAGYNRTKDLGAHMTNNHGAAPTPDLFVCVDCGMAFAYPNKLTSHRAAKHADKVAAEPPRAAEPADADASQREVDRAAKRKRRADKAVAAAAEKARATEAAAAVADEMPPPVDDAAPPSSSKSERKRRPRREPVEPIDPAAADAPVAVAADDDGGTAPAADHGERKRRRRSAPEDGEAAEDSNAPVDILGGDTAAEPSTGSKSRKPRDRTKHYACDKCELRFDRASRLERHIGIAHAAPLGDAVAGADQLDAGAVAVVAVDAAAPEESARKRERRERRSRRESDAPPPAAESGDGPAAVADPDGGAAPVADDGESRKRDRRDRRSRHSHSRDADAADVVPTEAGDEANVDAAADSAPHSASKRSRPSDEKRFLCPHCSFRFDRRGKLQTHIDAQHSGAAPADGGESGAAANDNNNDTTTDQPAEQVDAATDAGGAEATDAAKRPRRAARK